MNGKIFAPYRFEDMAHFHQQLKDLTWQWSMMQGKSHKQIKNELKQQQNENKG